MKKLIKTLAVILIGLIIPFTLLAQAGRPVKVDKTTIDQQGEFNYRLNLALNRLTGKLVPPVFSESFILADVNIDLKNPRRFYNFSGDLSGRFIEVMALASKDHPKLKVDKLVHRAISFQKKDGRFGNDTLSFKGNEINREHMALLWGNGRMLVGLMEYYQNYKDPAVLKSAIALAEFFIKSYEACADPKVAKKLEGFGATGIICFTQYIEGLVMLTKATGDTRYAVAAAKTYPILPERGIQHTHGYLTTLRGILYLYDYDQNKAHLNYVKEAYASLVKSKDYNTLGSVGEYFGGKNDRDEGCSTADFVRLSFALYQTTGELQYLEKGEFGLLNALYFNQYNTGDFGHHFLTATGTKSDYLRAAWWCCTMHGLRALYEIRDHYLFEKQKGLRKINLYLDADYKDEITKISIRKSGLVDGLQQFKFSVSAWDHANAISFRVPSWAETTAIKVNGKASTAKIADGYITLNYRPKKGDVITVSFKYALKVSTPTGLQKITQLAGLVKGQLHYGPYLLGVDDQIDPDFLAEPNSNIIYAQTLKPATINGSLSIDQLVGNYLHGGYPSYLKTTFRPIGEITFDGHGYMTHTFEFMPNDKAAIKPNQSMLEPWSAN